MVRAALLFPKDLYMYGYPLLFQELFSVLVPYLKKDF